MNRFVLAAALVSAFASIPVRALTPTDFAKKIDITISGYQGSETLTDFPVLVKLSESSISGFLYSEFQGTDGSDLRFTDANGIELDHDIELWDESGTSIVWVKVPSLSGTATKITAYYGNANPPAASASTDVWSDYTGVWHFGDPTTATQSDATGNGLTARAVSTIHSAALATGAVGYGVRNAVSGGNTAIGGYQAPSYGSFGLGDSFVVSGWFLHNGSVDGSQYDRIFSTKVKYDEATGFEIEHPKGSNTELSLRGADGSSVTASIPSENNGQWRQYTFVFDGTLVGVYTNGALSATVTLSVAPTDSDHLFSIGCNSATNEWVYNGWFDEVRLRDGSLSADWIAAEHKNIADDSFLTFDEARYTDPAYAILSNLAVARNGDGTFTVTADCVLGTDSSYTIMLELSDGVSATPEIVSGTIANGVFSATTPASLAAKTWNATIVVTGADSGVEARRPIGIFHTGDLSIAATFTPSSIGLGDSLVYTVTRADSNGDLPIAYTVDTANSTAVAGTHFTAPSGTVTIPNGATSATIKVHPLAGASTDLTLTLAISSGLYGISASAGSATGTILSSTTGFDFHDFAHTFQAIPNYSGTETVTDIPLLLRLSTAISGFDYADFTDPNGGDLRFADEDGNLIPHEIDTWDPDGVSLVWVKVPSLAAGTFINGYYGCANPVVQSASDVWTDYAGVWHLNDEAGTSADASGNGNDGTDRENVSAATGKVGGAKRMGISNGPSEAQGAGTIIANSASLHVAPTFTMSMWYNPAVAMDGTWAYLFSTKSSDGGASWSCQFRNKQLAFSTGGATDNTSHAPVFPASYAANKWTKLDTVFDGNTVSYYENGVLVDTKTSGSTAADGSGLAIGSMLGNGHGAFNGLIDEARLSTETRSAAWIAADYESQSSDSYIRYGEVLDLDPTAVSISHGALVRNQDGTYTATANCVLGNAASYTTVFQLVSGETITNIVGTIANGVFTATTPVDLPARTWNGSIVIQAADSGFAAHYELPPFYSGDISLVASQSTAAVSLGHELVYTVSRADTAGAFLVGYEVDAASTAVEGTYYAALSGSVLIPDGASSVDITVPVLAFDDSPHTLKLDLLPGFYGIAPTAASATGTILPEPATTFSPFDFQKSFTFQPTGFTGSDALVNFPVLVRLSTAIEGFDYADFADQRGRDLRFVDKNNNILPFEIETWDTSGTSLVWVKVLSLDAETLIDCFYGNGNPVPAPAATEVWSDYTGVWHFHDATVVQQSDSTGHGLTANAINAGKSLAGEAGIVGNAVKGSVNRETSAGANGGYLTPSYQSYALGNSFVVSGWFRHDGTVNGYERIFSSKTKYDEGNGFESEFQQNSNVGISVRGANGTSNPITVPDASLGLWCQYTYVYDGPTLTVYTNGAQSAQVTLGAAASDNNHGLAIGNNANKSEWAYHGWFDEVRLRDGSLSAEWVATEYKNITDATFLEMKPVLDINPAAARLTNPVIASNGDGTYDISVDCELGNDSSYTAELLLASGSQTNNITGLISNGAVSFTTPAALPEKTWEATIVVTGDTTGASSSIVVGSFYSGAVAIAVKQNAVPATHIPMAFTFSRAGTDGDLTVAYTVDTAVSTAAEGTDYEALPGKVTIPDGATSATIYVSLFETEGGTRTLKLDIEPGLYGILDSAGSATGMTQTPSPTFTPLDFSKTFEITPTGYTGTETLANFPVLVRLSTAIEGFDYADFADPMNGADLRFADDGGHELPFEIELWDSNGTSLVWVKVPELTATTKLHAYYGNDNPSAAPDPSAVWSRYAIVVHGGDTIENAVDNGLVATPGSTAVTATPDSGIAGGGIHKSTANSVGVNVSNPSPELTSSGQFTVSAWFKRNGKGGNDNGTHILVSSQTAWNANDGFLLLQEKGTYISVAAKGAHQWDSGNYTLADQTWGHVAFAYDKAGGSLVSYVDGVQDQSKSNPGNLENTSSTYWTFGSYLNTATADSFIGDMDELRVFNGAASGDWIATEHKNIADATFLRAGPVQAPTQPNVSTTIVIW